MRAKAIRKIMASMALFSLLSGFALIFTSEREVPLVSEEFFKNQKFSTGENYDYLTMSFESIPSIVRITAVENEEREFIFYILDRSNFESWKTGKEYLPAYVGITISAVLAFFPEHEGDYFLVAQTPEPPSERVILLSAEAEWWSYKERDRLMLGAGVFLIVFGFGMLELLRRLTEKLTQGGFRANSYIADHHHRRTSG